jgi:hypothetical protein
VIFRSSNPEFLWHYDLDSQLDAPPMNLPVGMASPLSTLFSRFGRPLRPLSASCGGGGALVDESQRFVLGVPTQETIDRVRWRLDQGGQTDGQMERDLGVLLSHYPQPLDV